MPTSSRITKSHYESLADFRYTLRKFLRFSEKAANAAGVSPQQHQAMLAIMGYPGRDRTTIGELAEQLQIKHHSAVGLADRLVAEKFARRLADQKDRRQVYLMLTKHGQALLKKLTTAHQEELRRMGPRIHDLLKIMREENSRPVSHR